MLEQSPSVPSSPAAQDALSSRQPIASGTRLLPSGTIPTDFLFQGAQEVVISHHGEHYRLRITRNGKLILTK